MFSDLLPTLCSVANVKVSDALDGIDFSDLLFGNQKFFDEQRILYWEFHEEGGKQALRYGDWKLVRLNVQEKGFHRDVELYNLELDSKEDFNVADKNPAAVDSLILFMDSEHLSSPAFPFNFERSIN